MHLPDTTGADVLALLSADPRTRNIPKVIVTADATPGLARRVEREGAVACMTKPLNVPAWSGAMIGHQMQQWTLPVGADVQLDAAKGTITMLAPAVS